MRRSLVLVCSLALALAACGGPRAGAGQKPAPVPSGNPYLAARALRPMASAAPPRDVPSPSWAEAVRAGDFREAERLLATLPAAERDTPEIRFVRARVLLGRKEAAAAFALLSGLEHDLPTVSDLVMSARAECELEVGPFEEAARYFSSLPDPDALVKGALAWERAHALDKARATLDHALRLLGSDDRAERARCRAEALAARVRVAKATKDVATAATDLRLLAVEAPASEAGRHAEEELMQLSPPARLTSEQRLTRAKNLAQAGLLDLALAELDALSKDAREKVSPADLAHARGWAYYLSRKDYGKAAELLDAAARLGGADAEKDAFYAARALSRADDDAHAIERYVAFAKSHPASSYAEEARYQSARLHLLLAEWDAARAGYAAYLDTYDKKRKGRFAPAARYELALAFLASGHAAEAAPLFSALADKETDPLDRASLRELQGAALADAGDKARAVEVLTGVIRERPLSLPALESVSRLQRLDVTLPPLLGSPPEVAPAAPLDVELPARVAFLARLGLAAEAERELTLHASELSRRYSPRDSEALCRAYGAIGTGAERYRVGRAAVKAEVLDREPTDATRWAWECLYPRPFDVSVRRAETALALPAGLLHAVMRQESAFRADAISPARAIGLLQLMPDTAARVGREIGVDADLPLLVLPATNVELGAYYFRKVFDTFGGNVALAAAAYNAGPRAVSRWLETGETLPADVFIARIPFPETRGYVARVVGNLARYTYLESGAQGVSGIPLELPQNRRAKETDY